MNALSIAFDSIWSHRLRSALAALEVGIGVFAVVTLTSLGAGARSYVSSQFRTLGATTITVSSALPAASNQGTSSSKPKFPHGPGAFAVPSTLTLEDAAATVGLRQSY